MTAAAGATPRNRTRRQLGVRFLLECTGPTGESPCALTLPNMTGANRLLIGIGWMM